MSTGGKKSTLDDIRAEIKARFEAEKRVLSFREYLELVRQNPRAHSRDASRYLKDSLDYFGSYEVQRPSGTLRRWKVFDLDFGERDGSHDEALRVRDRLAGHEHTQGGLYRVLEGFEREGRSNRLLLLHGPNGSAKSTFCACLMRGLEAYSETSEGALYRFSWIFPRTQDGRGIGFATSSDELAKSDSFAHLPEERIVAKLPSAIREHPLSLLPREARHRFLTEAFREAGLEVAAADWVWDGQLGSKNQKIFQALLTAYRGDLDRVLAHIQVERFYISRRYRLGAVTIGPQMTVDAAERQITADRSIESLPASLSSLALYEPFGELVDASGGIVEYSDLLKRPLDAWKYLLLAIENGEVSLTTSNLSINAVMIASSNELHLDAFRQHPEYNSFRGRLVLLRMPYLIDVEREQQIYDGQIVPQVQKHVAPHTTYVAALWAVLTRLKRPDPNFYNDADFGAAVGSLTPMEKMDLLMAGLVPPRFEADEAKLLRGSVAEIVRESANRAEYEGLSGASPREIRMLLLDAASDASEACLSPQGFLARAAQFCESDDYEFLSQSADGLYREHRAFVDIVRERWLDLVEAELREATGLIDQRSHMELFDRYVTHVSHWVKKERVRNPVTGEDEDPDIELMNGVETKLDVDDAETFRSELLSAVAAWAIDHQEQEVRYEELFPRYIEQLRQAYFAERREQIGDVGKAVMAVLEEDEGLDAEAREAGQRALAVLKNRYGYEDESVRVALGSLIAARHR